MSEPVRPKKTVYSPEVERDLDENYTSSEVGHPAAAQPLPARVPRYWCWQCDTGMATVEATWAHTRLGQGHTVSAIPQQILVKLAAFDAQAQQLAQAQTDLADLKAEHRNAISAVAGFDQVIAERDALAAQLAECRKAEPWVEEVIERGSQLRDEVATLTAENARLTELLKKGCV